jgi:hypothetical protein
MRGFEKMGMCVGVVEVGEVPGGERSSRNVRFDVSQLPDLFVKRRSLGGMGVRERTTLCLGWLVPP